MEWDLKSIKQRNQDAGMHWFSPKTMAFFKSRIDHRAGTIVEAGGQSALFITSEKKCFGDDTRVWSVRRAHVNGDVTTVISGIRRRDEAVLRRQVVADTGTDVTVPT